MKVSDRITGIATAIDKSTVVASLIAVSACSSALSPTDPSDIGAWMELYQVPGVSVAVIRDFEVAYVEVHGVKSLAKMEPVTEQTLFQAASISKSVTAMGVMSLVQDGTVALDRNVNDYLTSWQVPYNEFQSREKVTLRRLVSHTAGTTVHGFRGGMAAHPTAGYGVVVLTNSDNGSELTEAVIEVIGEREGWRGF